MGSADVDESELNIFSERLKEFRNYKKMTQKDFADKIGITAAALSAYENSGKNPSIAVVKRISKVFGVSIDWLCGLSEQMTLNTEPETLADIALKIIELLDSPYFFRLGRFKDLDRNPQTFYLDFPHIRELEEFFRNYQTLQNLSCNAEEKHRIINTWLDGAIEKLKKISNPWGFADVPDEGLPFN